MKDKFSTKLIVSNYNTDLEWLKITYNYGFSPENTIIYDRSDETKDWSNLGKSITSPNVGENIYDMMRFIIENYEDLPDISIFVKGNLLSKPGNSDGSSYYYTYPDRFIRAIQSNYFLPIERDCPVTNIFVNGGGYVERTWTPDSNIPRKYFSSFYELLSLLFVNPVNPEYIRFAPGGNYVVPKENILKFSKNFYIKLKLFSSYRDENDITGHSTCAEAYLIERLLYMMWTEDLIEKEDL
jgi:hypothetical protein